MRQKGESKSIFFLIFANVIPLFGVLFFSWSLYLILILYWLENVVVGIFNVGKMIRAEGPLNTPRARLNGEPYDRSKRGMLVTFFIIHYGLFTAGHGLFVFTFFKSEDVESLLYPMIIGFLSFMFSHLLSYIFNFIKNEEYKKVAETTLFIQPYKRVVILHITILFGASAIAKLGTPIEALIILIVSKTVIDIISHKLEHTKFTKMKPTPTY